MPNDLSEFFSQAPPTRAPKEKRTSIATTDPSFKKKARSKKLAVALEHYKRKKKKECGLDGHI